jgi:hypothetical protein
LEAWSLAQDSSTWTKKKPARDIAADLLKGLHGAEEIRDIEPRDITPMAPAIPQQQDYPAEQFTKNFPAWEKLIKDGKKTADEIVNIVSSKAVLSDEQKTKIREVKKLESKAPDVDVDALASRLKIASDMDMLDADADLIGAVDDPEKRKELTAVYEGRKAELNQ